MDDLAKKNNGSGTTGGADVANGNGTIDDKNGVTDKIDTTRLSAAELYRRGRALCFGVYGVKIDRRRGVALLEAAVEAGRSPDASEETKGAALDAQAELAERTSDGLEDAPPDWERAVELAAKPAEAGNPFALFTLANAAADGRGGVAKNKRRANALQRRAAEAFLKRAKDGEERGDEDPRALCFAANYLYAGEFVERDAAEAVRLYRRSVELGCAESARNLGVCYLNGDVVEENPTEAARWLRRAAELGVACAAETLSRLYALGLGVEKSDEETFRWLRAAAEGGHIGAARTLAATALEKRDSDGVVRWFKKAAQLGDRASAGTLGTIYEGVWRCCGWRAVEPNEAEALAWYRRAVELGDAPSAARLGFAFERGQFGLEPNDAEAVRLYRLAADGGDARGLGNLGCMYAAGRGGLEQNDEEANRLFRRAWGLGNREAGFELGLYYWRDGEERDPAEAIRWFRKAEGRGCREAEQALAEIYRDWIADLNLDPTEALHWLRRASVGGCVEAAKKLAEMYRDGCANLNVEPNAAEAVRFFRRAWGLGDATAAFELGTLYSLDGDARDGAAALRWFRKGAEAGCVEAAKKLVEFYRDGNADLNVEPNAAKAERWRRVADGKDGEGGE